MTGVNGVVADARVIAQAAADELERSDRGTSVQAVLDRYVSRAQSRYRRPVAGARAAAGRRQPATGDRAGAGARVTSVVRAGPWSHLTPPDRHPGRRSGSGDFEGILSHGGTSDEPLELIARAVARSRSQEWSIVADVPIDEAVWTAIEETSGIQMVDLAPGRRRAPAASSPRPARRRRELGALRLDAHRRQVGGRAAGLRSGQGLGHAGDRRRDGEGPGRAGRHVPPPVERAGRGAWPRPASLILGFITLLFLVVEGAALAMGWALARSITGNVHALFQGTERLRLGDLGHRIPIRSRDQLGELAESFNAMSANIETLLEQAAEKRRLEEELRIAREIQMSLLPRHAAPMAGLALAALCVPAREVGGDYYDFFALGPRRLGPARRRRGRQGDVGRALHGGAEGADALAQPDPRVAASAADRGQPDHRREPRQPQLHHHDLRRRRPRAADADLRAGRPHAARAPHGVAAAAGAAGRAERHGRRPAARWPRASLRRAARGGHGAARSTATCSCSTPTG